MYQHLMNVYRMKENILGLKAQVKWHIEQREKALNTTECLPIPEVKQR
jgi:hypothetical protein